MMNKIGIVCMSLSFLGLLVELLVWVNNIWMTCVGICVVLMVVGGALISVPEEGPKEKLIDRGSFAKYVEEEENE